MEKVTSLEKINQQLIEDDTLNFFEGANWVPNNLREATKTLDKKVVFNELITYQALKITQASNLTQSPSKTTNNKARVGEESLDGQTGDESIPAIDDYVGTIKVDVVTKRALGFLFFDVDSGRYASHFGFVI